MKVALIPIARAPAIRIKECLPYLLLYKTNEVRNGFKNAGFPTGTTIQLLKKHKIPQ